MAQQELLVLLWACWGLAYSSQHLNSTTLWVLALLALTYLPLPTTLALYFLLEIQRGLLSTKQHQEKKIRIIYKVLGTSSAFILCSFLTPSLDISSESISLQTLILGLLFYLGLLFFITDKKAQASPLELALIYFGGFMILSTASLKVLN